MEMAVETVTIDIVANFKNQTSTGLRTVEQDADRVSRSISKTKKEMDRLGGTTAKPSVSLVDKASSSISSLNSKLKSFAGKTWRTSVKIVDYATRPLRAIKNSLFSIKGLVMAIGAGWAANKLISNPLSLADAYSSAKIGFSTLLGDAEGQNMMNKLDEFAKATPFKTSGVISNAQKMMAMGWNPEDIIKDMETIGDAAAATGKMDQGLESIVRALSQIKTKGKLSTEELNQLSEAGIAAKAMLAEQLGYGTGDKGIAAMTADLEDGLIGSEVAIQALLQGMKQYEGTMKKTANETVEGLKSQIEDTFEINVFRRWGQGLQDGAKRGFGSILELLDKSEGSLEKFGDTVYEIGKELSNWAADKLEGTIDKILEVTDSRKFKEASLGGKIKILWDDVIAKPFGKWWDSTGKPYMVEKLNTIGEAIGSGLSKSLLALLGIDINTDNDAVTLGSSFASGFAKGFEGKKVWDALVKAAGRAFKAGFSALFNSGAIGKIIAGGIALKVTGGILSGISKVSHFWYGSGGTSGFGTSGLGYTGGGLKGFLGGASTASGVLEGSGLIGKLASLGAKATGHGGLLGGTPYTAGGLTVAGLGTAAGIVGGVAGLGNSVVDLTKAVTAQTSNDKKLYGTRSATKAGLVGIGAGIGTIIAPGIGTAIGAGLGGLATFLAGDKLADAISGVSKSTAQLNEEAEELASQRLADKFDGITLSAEQLSKKVTQIFGERTIARVNGFTNALSQLDNAKYSANNYIDDLAFTHERIMDKEDLSTTDIDNYKNSLEGYAQSVKDLITTNKTASNKAYALLFGDDAKGAQKATKSMNSMYTKLEKELAKKSENLNKVISDAFSDGKITIDEEKKINEIVSQIENIQRQIDERLKAKEEAKSEATYDLIEEKFKNNDFDLKSFQKVLSELDAQRAIDDKAYDDARIEATADVKMQLKLGEINEKEANKKLAEIEAKWREGKTITLKRNIEFSFDIIDDKYGNEIDTFAKSDKTFSTGQLSSLKDSTYTRKRNVEYLNWNDNAVADFEEMKNKWLESAGVDLALQKEMSTLYESLKPQEQDLIELKKSYEEAGEEIPKWIEDSLSEINNIKIMSGDIDSFYKVVGEQLASEDPTYAKNLIKEQGEKLPKALREGIEEGIKSYENEGDIEINKDGNVTVNATVDTSKAKETADSKTKSEVGKDVDVTKTAKVTADSETTGEGAAADKSKGEVKSALDSRFGVPVSERGKVKITGLSMSGLASAVSSAWSSFKETVRNKFSGSIYTNPQIKHRIGVAPTSKSDKEGKNANGSYVDRAIRTIVGEAGPEFIIPVSANRRQRGKYLWERAGRALGVYDGEKTYMNANGGLYGSGSSKLANLMSGVNSVGNTSNTQQASVGGKVNVNVGGIEIVIQSNGNGVQDDIKQNADSISEQIAEILENAFNNIPVTVGS